MSSRVRPVTLSLLLAAGAPGLWGCSDKSAADGSCTPEAVTGIEATVDGASWSASDVTWSDAGDSVHITSTAEGAGWISIVGMSTSDGENVVAAIDAGEFPVEVTLKTSEEGGFAVWYTDDADSSSTTEGGEGLLAITSEEDDQITGCLSFDAGPDGAEVSFEDGHFVAVPQ